MEQSFDSTVYRCSRRLKSKIILKNEIKFLQNNEILLTETEKQFIEPSDETNATPPFRTKMFVYGLKVAILYRKLNPFSEAPIKRSVLT